MTPCLVKIWFWEFCQFLGLRRDRFDIETLDLEIEILKIDLKVNPQKQTPKRFTKNLRKENTKNPPLI